MLRRFASCLYFALLVMAVPAAAAPVKPTRIADFSRPVAQLFIDRTPAPAEIAARNTGARFEPPLGCYLGAYIELDTTLNRMIVDHDSIPRRDPAQFEERVARPHAMYFFYLGYGKQPPLGWIRTLAERRKFVHIALEPNDGLDRVQEDAYLTRLADDLARTGASIFLRFGSEMNGAWTNYHQAGQFREKFRLVYTVMHRRAPNVALVWCPYAMPVGNIADYYPGDAYTDWVGVNMYSVIYHDNRRSAYCEHEHPNDLLAAVYTGYARRKPMMICEFAATHYSLCDRRMRPDFARRKISTLYAALPRLFPRIKAINYFDLTADGVHNDYSVTTEPSINRTYRSAVGSSYYLSGGEDPSRPPGSIPMPIREGERVSGVVRVSCFARTPSDRVVVTYLLDGRAVYRANSAERWTWDWDTGKVSAGRHTLTLAVQSNESGKSRYGRVSLSHSVHVDVVR